MLHTYFDKTFLINLDKRQDRLTSVTKRCEDIGLVFERYPAIDGKELQIALKKPNISIEIAGLVLTHKGIIENAKSENLNSILILEDDVEFHPSINEIVENFFSYIPNDWEMIYFGAFHYSTEPVSESIVRTNYALFTHCYAIRETIFDLILDNIDVNRANDFLYTDIIHPRRNSYAFMPNLAFQIDDHSDISNKRVKRDCLR